MQLPTLAFGIALGVAGFAAGRGARATPDAPVCAVERVVAAAPPRVQPADSPRAPAEDDGPQPCPDGTITIASTPVEDSDGDDIGELIAHAETHVREHAREHNAITGHVTDGNGDLAGCTIVVTSPALQGAQTAISDQHGNFAIIDLPAGTYLVTYYFNDTTVERSGVSVSEFSATQASQEIQQRVPYVEDDYVANIPVVITADGESFSSRDTLDNTYYVDGEVISPLPE